MQLSPTSLAAWTQCERLYEALYLDRQTVLGVRLPAMRSTWVHKGISALLSGGYARGVAREMATGFQADFNASRMVNTFGDPIVHHQSAAVMASEQAALVEACILGWHRQRGKALDGWRVLQTERASTLALGPSRFHESVEFVIRPDWVLVDDTNMVMRPFDLKLTSAIDDDWINQWTVSPQGFWYHFALSRLYPGYRIEPMWIEAIDVGRAGKLRHNSPLIYGWAAQAEAPFDADLVWYETPPRRARLFRAWSTTDCKVADPLARWIEQLPERILQRRFIRVEGVPPAMSPEDVNAMFADVPKIADQIEARTREGHFRWTGLMAQTCASPYDRCKFYRRCYRVDDWEKWYGVRSEQGAAGHGGASAQDS